MVEMLRRVVLGLGGIYKPARYYLVTSSTYIMESMYRLYILII